MKRLIRLGVLAWLFTASLSAQQRKEVDAFLTTHRPEIVRELVELLSIPNVAADRANVRRNAELLARRCFVKRGFTAEILETDGNPLVFAELRSSRVRNARCCSTRTTTDSPSTPKGVEPGQPVHAGAADARLEDGGKEIPNFLTLQQFPPEARLYARSASDDKAPIIALLTARRRAGVDEAAVRPRT